MEPVFDKKFVKFVCESRNYSIRVYETGLVLLNSFLGELVEFLSKESDLFSMRKRVETMLEGSMYLSTFLEASDACVRDDQELPKDLPTAFRKNPAMEKRAVQFLLSFAMHFLEICIIECSAFKSLTDKNLQNVKLVQEFHKLLKDYPVG